MSIHGIWWLTGNVVADPPDPYARIRTLEAELTQARADRDKLAIEVLAVRNYDNLHEPGRTSPPRDQINEARKAVDAAGVLYRTGAPPG